MCNALVINTYQNINIGIFHSNGKLPKEKHTGMMITDNQFVGTKPHVWKSWNIHPETSILHVRNRGLMTSAGAGIKPTRAGT